ncbi:MAG: HlyD family efflux transporter periplasmic adaptor subunit [Synechococcaceae bacterium WB6_3B_236]|nr:HlyD family efflux transporter periplasmic adaptor subunit [Synechococcaceae bacterium WB6_3B_236]
MAPELPPASTPPAKQPPRFRTNRAFGMGRQGMGWSRAVVWFMIGGTGVGMVIGFVGRVDETIQVRGVIEGSDGSDKVVSTLTKRVGNVFVKNGEYVEKGEVLLTLENREEVAQARDARDIVAMKERRLAVLKLRNGHGTREDEALASVRPQLEEEAERINNQDKIKIASAQLDLTQAELSARQTEQTLSAKAKELELNRSLLRRYSGLLANGAVAEVQVLEQGNKVRQLESAVASTQEELSKNRARAAVQRMITSSTKERLDLDSERLESQTVEEKAQALNRLSDLRSRVDLTIIRASMAGKISGLSKQPGQLVAAGEEVVSVIPDDRDVAKLVVPDMNVGFLSPGMEVQLRLDAYTYSEFGSIKGRLVDVGPSLLPPDKNSPRAPYFPAKVKLQAQSIKISGKQIPLRSGMGVTALIKVRDKPMITLLTDMFSKGGDKTAGM